jgi:hypothetical protein
MKQGNFNITLPQNTGFMLVGNPYPSPLDFDRVYNNPGNSAVIKRQFWVWDASLGDGGNYKLIKYMNGQYLQMPAGTPTSLTSIQSGQGFFVESLTTAGGILAIREDDKTLAAPTPLNVLLSQGRGQKFSIDLLQSVPGRDPSLADGVVSVMDTRYVTAPTDADDVMKPVAADARLGVCRGNSVLMLDARPPLGGPDTTLLQISHLRKGTYHLSIRTEELAQTGRKAWLRDKSRDLMIPVSLDGKETLIAFTLDADLPDVDKGRFSLIITPPMVQVGQIASQEGGSSARVYPNPVTDRSYNLGLTDLPAGKYTVQLHTNEGKLVRTNDIIHRGGSEIFRLDIPYDIMSGSYHLRLVHDGRVVMVERLIVK